MKLFPHLIVCALVAILFPLDGMAQWSIGIDAGFDYNQPRVNTQYAYTRNYSCGPGATLALPVQYNFLDWVGLVLEPGFQYRSTQYTQSALYKEWQHNLYMEVPLMVNFSFGSSKVRGFVNLGGYIGGWLAGWQDQYVTIDNRQAHDVVAKEFTDQNNRFDAGLVGGIGLRWLCDRKVSMSLQYRYYWDMVSCEKPHKVGSYNRYDNLHTITLGVHFNITKPQQSQVKQQKGADS